MGARSTYLQGDSLQTFGDTQSQLHDPDNPEDRRKGHLHLRWRVQPQGWWRYWVSFIRILVLLAAILHWGRLWTAFWDRKWPHIFGKWHHKHWQHCGVPLFSGWVTFVSFCFVLYLLSSAELGIGVQIWTRSRARSGSRQMRPHFGLFWLFGCSLTKYSQISNKIAEFHSKIAEFHSKIVEFHSKIVKFYPKIVNV